MARNTSVAEAKLKETIPFQRSNRGVRSFYKNSNVPFLKSGIVFVRVLNISSEEEAKTKIRNILIAQKSSGVTSR